MIRENIWNILAKETGFLQINIKLYVNKHNDSKKISKNHGKNGLFFNCIYLNNKLNSVVTPINC